MKKIVLVKQGKKADIAERFLQNEFNEIDSEVISETEDKRVRIYPSFIVYKDDESEVFDFRNPLKTKIDIMRFLNL